MKLVSAIVPGCAILLLGCKPAATDQELNAMCHNLVKVRGEGEAPDAKKLTGDIHAEFDKKRQSLLDWKARDMNGWDKDLEQHLIRLEKNPNAKGDDGKPLTPAKLKESYQKKKEIGAKQFDADLATLAEDRKKRLSEVSETIRQKQAELDEKIKDCLDAAKSENVSSDLAQCRTKAPDKDSYWNKCR